MNGVKYGLLAQLPTEQAAAVAQQIAVDMEKTTDADALDSLGGAPGSLSEKLSDREMFSVLKALPIVGERPEEILAELEKRAEEDFGGNLWKAVDWAEKQGIYVKNVSRLPRVDAN